MIQISGMAAQAADWAPVQGHIITRWAKVVTPTNALPEYPRPQMERKDWLNLNGLWDLAITKKDESRPGAFYRKILVPYPVESALSGVGHIVKPDERVWYKRTVGIPKTWQGGPNGFGINGGTSWENSDIWLRHSYEIQTVPAKAALNIFYHADVEIYLNSKEAAKLTGFNKYHEEFPLSPDAVKILKPGKNSIAIHCKQTSGGQNIDCGIVELPEAKK